MPSHWERDKVDDREAERMSGREEQGAAQAAELAHPTQIASTHKAGYRD